MVAEPPPRRLDDWQRLHAVLEPQGEALRGGAGAWAAPGPVRCGRTERPVVQRPRGRTEDLLPVGGIPLLRLEPVRGAGRVLQRLPGAARDPAPRGGGPA